MGNELTIFRGDDRTIRVTVTDADGAAYDLAGAVLYFNVKKDETDLVSLISKSSAVASEILVIGPTTDGIFDVFILPADTAALIEDYVYDITMIVGGKTYTLVKAGFDVTLPVK